MDLVQIGIKRKKPLVFHQRLLENDYLMSVLELSFCYNLEFSNGFWRRGLENQTR